MKEFLKSFGQEELFKNAKVLDNEYYLIPVRLRNVINTIKKKPVFVGSFLGRKKKGFFHPSSFFFDELVKKTKKVVVVNEKASWLFLCKKNTLGKNIVKDHNTIENNDLVLVLNECKECLGYGKVIKKGKDIKIVQHVFDLGNFLRREK